MASQIDAKYADLKAHGLDLGQPTGPEQSAGYGGTFRAYQSGHIYWHPVMGASAHEVHGGILSIYLANGGPGVNPKTGVRQFGFPLSDESPNPRDRTPFSMFETGAIYWTQGTGGVVMYGDIYAGFKAHANRLGLPISNQAPVANGEAVYCERGVVWSSPAIKGSALVGLLNLPLMGQPMIVAAGVGMPTIVLPNPTGPQAKVTFDPVRGVSLGNVIEWSTSDNDLAHRLSLVPPSVLSDVWNNRLLLSPVVSGDASVPLLPGVPDLKSIASDPSVAIALTAASQLQESKLYDIYLTPPFGNAYNLSPHAVYAKKSWDNFGLLHATDLHLSLRNENLRAALTRAGMTDAAQHYANCQDCFRDFIRYANHLHARGLVDAVMGTGDLIDYVVEPGDNPYTGNFARLRRMILGQPFDVGVPAGEELQVPIFLTFGNHDYRLNSYDLSFNIDVNIPFVGENRAMDEYSTFNLTPDEATAAQGGPITYGISDFAEALKMLTYDDSGGAYAYFSKYFSPTRTFTVKLGAHRLVLLDNSYDAGVPVINDWADLLAFLYNYDTNSLSHDTDRAINGTINADGLSDKVYSRLKPALDQAGAKGVVIVGMHVPPFSPVNSEYPYYLRETVHPLADPKLTDEYLGHNGIKRDGWTLTGTPHFKSGGIGDGQGLDNGVLSKNGMDFLRLLAGANLGVSRPVDLFLCGHHHDRTEYRIRWNGTALEYFMDFYLETPQTYYSTRNGFDLQAGGQTIPAGSRLWIKIDRSAPAAGNVGPLVYHQGELLDVHGSIVLPPYATPLETAADPKAWWQDHRPIIAQTAALGPIDPRQRVDPQWDVHVTGGSFGAAVNLSVESKTKPAPAALPGQQVTVTRAVSHHPEPTFNGFRLVQVQANVIRNVRYITMAELRAANFKLPWERPVGQGSGGDNAGQVTGLK